MSLDRGADQEAALDLAAASGPRPGPATSCGSPVASSSSSSTAGRAADLERRVGDQADPGGAGVDQPAADVAVVGEAVRRSASPSKR